jgi:hypothetical protein
MRKVAITKSLVVAGVALMLGAAGCCGPRWAMGDDDPGCQALREVQQLRQTCCPGGAAATTNGDNGAEDAVAKAQEAARAAERAAAEAAESAQRAENIFKQNMRK